MKTNKPYYKIKSKAQTKSLMNKTFRRAKYSQFVNSLKSTIQIGFCLALICQNLFLFGGQSVVAQTSRPVLGKESGSKPSTKVELSRKTPKKSAPKGRQQAEAKKERGVVLAVATVNVAALAEREAKLAAKLGIRQEQLEDRAKTAKDKNKLDGYEDKEEGEDENLPDNGELPPGATLLKKQDFPSSFGDNLTAPQVASPSPAISFQGLDDGFVSIPPDTMGAVGPNHVVTALNDRMRIQNRSGVVLTNQTFTTDSFWAPLANTANLPYALSTFDPKIYFDRVSNRWIYTITANGQNANSAILLAVSKTPDPTGSWTLYGLDVDSTNTNWADYPSIGFNNQWIVVQLNMYTNAANAFVRPDIYVFNKAQAVAGAATLDFTKFTGVNTNVPGDINGGTWAPSIDPGNASPNTMWFAQGWNSQSGLIRISKLTGTVGNETISPGIQLPQSPESWLGNQVSLGSGWAPQGNDTQTAPSTTYLAANDNRIQNLVLRGTSLWAVHTVFLPTIHQPAGTSSNSVANPANHSAIQWWQINSTIETPNQVSVPLQRGLIEDTAANNCHNGSGALKSPCTPNGTFYAFPSIAVNDLNDVLIGFSRFNALTWAGAAYAYRDHTDLPNTFRDPFLYKAGEGRYAKLGNGAARWGDYSSALVDPNNDRSFWTAQEYAAPRINNNTASVWSTYWAQVHSLTARNAFSISGVVTYGTFTGLPAKLVSGVQVSAAGSSSVSSNLDLVGGYLLNNLNSGGNYTVTPTKTGDANGISPFDATMVLRHIAANGTGPNALNANQQIAADTNGDGNITPFDATLILRYIASGGPNANTGQTGNWKFDPAFTPHPVLNSSITSENYTAILVGEVNGDWTPPSVGTAPAIEEVLRNSN